MRSVPSIVPIPAGRWIASVAALSSLALAGLVAPTGAAADTADRAGGTRAYTADALSAINAARTKKKREEVSSDACMKRFAQRIARRDAKAGRLHNVSAQPVYRTCGLHYVTGMNAKGKESGAETINQIYLKDAGARQMLLKKENRLAGLGAAQAEDGTWFFMVWVADYRTGG